jgi:hypothetical protein
MDAADRKLVNTHRETLLADAAANGIPEDVLGRLLVSAAIGIWRNSRSVEGIAEELRFTIDNLDPDTDYPFMRP